MSSTQQTFVGVVFPMPEPSDVEVTAKSSERAAEVLEQWRHHLPGGHHFDGNGDFEDFWEMAFRLDAILRSGADHLALSVNDRTDQSGANVYGRELVSLPRYGPVTRYSEGQHCAEMEWENRVNRRYWDFAAFKKHSGRRVISCGISDGMPPVPNPELSDVLSHWRDDGTKKAFVKSTQPKRIPGIAFDIAAEGDPFPKEVMSEIADVGLSLIGYPNTLLLQEYVPMVDEYRFFVVGGEVVTGSGCIENFTPLNSIDGQPFDLRVAGVRRDGEAPREDESLVLGTYLPFASSVADSLAVDDVHTCVIDVAINVNTGKPVVVELNGILNSGLYASDPRYITRAMVAQARSKR